MTVSNSPLARKLGAFVALSEADLHTLAEMQRCPRSFAAGRDMVQQGEPRQHAYILTSGWASSYRLLPAGTRQIVDFQLPGDFLGLRSLLVRAADHMIEPVTRVEASEVSFADLVDCFNRTPRLATAILWAVSRDEAMVVEHLVGIGRRNAHERTAHFFLELDARLSLVGLASPQGYDCPLSQYQLADALGLTAIHINRVLREFRRTGLMTFRKGKVVFLDRPGLLALAGFDIAYLDHDGPLLK